MRLFSTDLAGKPIAATLPKVGNARPATQVNVPILAGLRAGEIVQQHKGGELVNPISNEPWDTVLTDREREILELIAKGLSAKHVAQRIKISPRTVERHIENLRAKTHTRNSTHMIAFAYRNGILSADGAENASQADMEPEAVTREQARPSGDSRRIGSTGRRLRIFPGAMLAFLR